MAAFLALIFLRWLSSRSGFEVVAVAATVAVADEPSVTDRSQVRSGHQWTRPWISGWSPTAAVHLVTLHDWLC